MSPSWPEANPGPPPKRRNGLAAVDEAEAPGGSEAGEPGEREGIDDKAQRNVGRKRERDGQHGADSAGMYDQHDVVCGQARKTIARAGDLIDKTLAAGRAVFSRRHPECAIGLAEFGREIV